jgi:hypothetical protein
MYVFMYDCPARRVDAELRTAMRDLFESLFARMVIRRVLHVTSMLCDGYVAAGKAGGCCALRLRCCMTVE